MSGKHPIDDLFARALRDAEVTPPPPVWEGIARERASRSTLPQLLRRNWGLSAMLLFFVGASGFLAFYANTSNNEGKLAQQEELTRPGSPQKQVVGASHAQAISIDAASETSDRSIAMGASANVTTTPAFTTDSNVEKANTAVPVSTQTVNAKTSIPVAAKNDRAEPGKAIITSKKARSNNTSHPHASGEKTDAHEDTKVVVAMENNPAKATVPNDPLKDHSTHDVPINEEGNPTGSSSMGPTPQKGRSVPNESLEDLIVRTSPLPLLEAKQPSPILPGKTIDPYVMAKGNWWIGAQVEWAALNSSWSGAGAEVDAMNAGETWRDRKGLSVVVGREWQSGVSLGLGVGISQQRSRFLHRTVEAGTTETMIDTAWTATPSGPQTSFTWDIVETQITEPGTEQLYNSTNVYTQLRIAPEISYRLVERRRLSIQVRLSPMINVTLSRSGNALAPMVSQEPLDSSATSLTVVSLGDASLNERFPLSLALSGGLDLRYQLCDRFSIGLLPNFVYGIPREVGRTPRLNSVELGGALRLRYDIRHKECKAKQPIVPILQ